MTDEDLARTDKSLDDQDRNEVLVVPLWAGPDSDIPEIKIQFYGGNVMIWVNQATRTLAAEKTTLRG